MSQPQTSTTYLVISYAHTSIIEETARNQNRRSTGNGPATHAGNVNREPVRDWRALGHEWNKLGLEKHVSSCLFALSDCSDFEAMATLAYGTTDLHLSNIN